MHTTKALTTVALSAFFSLFTAFSVQASEGEGLSTSPRWQGRVLLGTAPSSSALGSATDKWAGTGSASASFAVRSFSVLGDYYFGTRLANRAALGASSELLEGGFRATSGLVIGPRSAGLPMLFTLGSSKPKRNFSVDLRSAYLPPGEPIAGESNAVPYVGLGYTGVPVKGGWGFSADVGVMALNPGSAVKLGRVVGGAQSLDEVLREMRVSPTLQFGASYSF